MHRPVSRLTVCCIFLQVSFTSEFEEDPPLLVPSWGGGNGCGDCVEFNSGFPRDGVDRIEVTSERTIGGWDEQAVLQAPDRRSGDRFGATLALDKVKGSATLDCLFGLRVGSLGRKWKIGVGGLTPNLLVK